MGEAKQRESGSARVVRLSGGGGAGNQQTALYRIRELLLNLSRIALQQDSSASSLLTDPYLLCSVVLINLEFSYESLATSRSASYIIYPNFAQNIFYNIPLGWRQEAPVK